LSRRNSQEEKNMSLHSKLLIGALTLIPAVGLAGDKMQPGTGGSPTTGTGSSGSMGTGTTGTGATGTTATGTTAAVGSPAEILAKVNHINQMEIDAGKLAEQNADSKKVKQYGSKLVKDHTKAQQDVKTYATKNNISLTASEPMAHAEKQKHAATMDQLKTLKGPAFDTQFLTAMVSGHEEAIQLVQAAADQNKTNDLGKLLNKILPQLKEHRDEAAKLQASAGGKTSGMR
jgi:putative membrane protein